ncbi:MAG: Tol-Pal system protein TolQ [Chlamydiales bacterium]|nr:Tol-Pal system protein TolQ [Chlamydiales bacterium]MCH9635344.1 Tol-Pal system protein TolQ [Chlamydiales bacterium]MCH9703322.1 MotA/TolQ/ExbB proton channel family protein [Chlamydiota bacterium]
MDISHLARYFTEWNTVLVVIALCSLVSMAIFFERLFFLRRAEIDVNSLIIQLRRALGEQNLMEAIRTCEERGGSVSNILRCGLMKHERSREDIEQAMETAGLAEIARLEKNARILSVIAHIAPLIGLLGTVIGFIQAFSEMRVSGLMDISTTRVGEAMEYALVTTAAGLVVAIPTVVAYNYLISRIHAITLEMQITSSEVVDLLTHRESYAL